MDTIKFCEIPPKSFIIIMVSSQDLDNIFTDKNYFVDTIPIEEN
jgi:hypothetical protein